MRFVLLALVIVVMASCSQMMKRRTIDESQLSENTKLVLGQAQELLRANELKPAMAKLAELNDNTISPVAKAIKYNLKGVVLFNMGEIEKSLLNFEVSDKYSPKGTQLYSQVQLNMASAHFKLNQFNEMSERLGNIEKEVLSDAEKRKFSQLALAYGNKVQNSKIIVSSTVSLLSDAKTFSDIQNSNLYEPLKENFKNLSQAQKIEVLEEFNDSKNLGIAYLAQLEAEERYLAGDKSGANDVLSWLKSEFNGNPEVDQYINDFETRLRNASRISMSDIGLVLPLSGEKASFGQKALNGVDTALKMLGLNENLKIHTKDTRDNPAEAAQAVLNLIREDKVAFIIGGLFPESAKAEYLEARKYGVLYISLSQINLPKEEKNHNLIEVQGSIESQVETLLSDQMINKFGRRLGVIFPESEGGKAYVDEIWRKANEKNVSVTSIAAFPKGTHDYRDTAKLFLGLKYPRERSEEFEILENVYSLEKTTIRRIQTLPPVIDFDWVFLASYPHEAAQIIPTLGYYDANRIRVVGGPSWVSQSMVKEQKNLGTLYFVGDDPKDINQDMLNKYQEMHGKPASLIEVIAIDAMKIGAEAMQTANNISGRDEFDAQLKEKGTLKGLTTTMEFKDGVWIKKMNPMTITRGEIVKLFKTAP